MILWILIAFKEDYQQFTNAVLFLREKTSDLNNYNNNDCVVVTLIAVSGRNCKDTVLRGQTKSI